MRIPGFHRYRTAASWPLAALASLWLAATPAAAQEVIAVGDAISEDRLGPWTLFRTSEGYCVVSADAEDPGAIRLVAVSARGDSHRLIGVDGPNRDRTSPLGFVFSNGQSATAAPTVVLEGKDPLPVALPALVLASPDAMEPHPYVRDVGGQLMVVVPPEVRRDEPEAIDEAYAWIERRQVRTLRSDVDEAALWRWLAQSNRVTVTAGSTEARFSLQGSNRALRALSDCANDGAE